MTLVTPMTDPPVEGNKWDALAKDTQAESDGSYISPNSECANTYIILMTDGEPQYDTGANQRIKTLTGETCDDV